MKRVCSGPKCSTADAQVQLTMSLMVLAADTGKCVQQVKILTATGTGRTGRQVKIHTTTGTGRTDRPDKQKLVVGDRRLRELPGFRQGWQQEISPGISTGELHAGEEEQSDIECVKSRSIYTEPV